MNRFDPIVHGCLLSCAHIPISVEPYEAFPQEVTGPTLWTADDYRSESAKPKWVRWWSADEISQIEAASKLWKESGRPLTEIEQVSCSLIARLVEFVRFGDPLRGEHRRLTGAISPLS